MNCNAVGVLQRAPEGMTLNITFHIEVSKLRLRISYHTDEIGSS